ncbi:hypothetical protein HGRIS_001978 [Hohenbuehelia grisea]|uniref:Nab2 type CCCH zinc finger 4 domain-containing protein n=1 Tax=Hohenbuehelia grisea TaxID=104357 RepID=A0ABR3JKD2_9AGAR
MPFGLSIGTDRSNALQTSIQEELMKRGYSPDADPVMAEYITIMIINNKTPEQVTNELEDLIGSDYDSSFTEWLFAEAAKGAETSATPQTTAPAEPPAAETSTNDVPPPTSPESTRRPPHGPRHNGVYQQALSQALPTANASTGQKRAASARSPSPGHPNKQRRTDLPTGPRAMLRDGQGTSGSSRSLLDRVGPAGPMRNGPGNHRQDEIQARIDNITNGGEQPMMMGGGFPGMGVPGGMDMNMANPILLQEMMMNQMAMMAQMASQMGMLNGAQPQFGGAPGFPMQGPMPGEMGMGPGGNQNGFNGQSGNGRGRGGPRGGRGIGRGRGGAQTSGRPSETTPNPEAPAAEQPVIAAPVPTPAVPAPVAPAPAQPTHIPYALPERPQTPSLCKFGLKCTNAHCRYSHPSPVATAESGVVLSNDPCENGKDCKDKDCIKAHVSPAVLNPNAADQPPPHAAPQPPPAPVHAHSSSAIPCRFGNACTRPNCTFSHPARQTTNSPASIACRFGTGCTRATCPFQHPEGRVLPTSFHRGLSTNAPLVTVATPETGSMGGPSPHKSVKFNSGASGASAANASLKEKLQNQMREIEEKKSQAEKAIKEAEEAAAKKDGTKPVAITA